MTTITIKIDKDIFKEMEENCSALKISKDAYINKALKIYTLKQKRKRIKKQIQKESLLIRDESMKILKEFEAFELDE